MCSGNRNPFLFALILLLLLVTAGQAKLPLPAGPMAPRRLPYMKRVHRHELRIIDEYDKHTTDPRELRESAHKLLTFAKRVSLNLKIDMTRVEAHRLGTDLMAKGSKDPLVVMVTMQTLPNLNNKDEIKAHCDRAIKDVLLRYGPRQQIEVITWCHQIQMGLHNTYRRERNKFKRPDYALLNDAYVRWIASDPDSLEAQRRMWVIIDSYYLNKRAYFGPQLLAMAKKSKDKKIHPWMRHMLDAWSAGYVGKREQWKEDPKYKITLREAAQHYQAAWKLGPEFPEAATELVQLARAGHIDGTPRDWFDRAIAAELDHPMAYTYYRTHLRSKGTEALISFGRECAATRRYDTKVPFELLECYWAVENHTGENIWARDGVYEILRDFCQDAIKAPDFQTQPQTDATRAWLTAIQVAVAARAKRYEEIAPLLEKTNDASLKAAMRAYHVRTPLPALKATASSAKFVAMRLVNAVEKSLIEARDKESFEEVAKMIEAATSKLEKDDPRLAQWRAWLTIYQEFYNGRWADITFPKDAPKLAGATKWERIDRRTLATHGTHPFPLEFMAHLPAPYEISCQIRILDMPNDVLMAGFQFGTERPEINLRMRGRYFGLNSRIKKANIDLNPFEFYYPTFKETNEVRVRAWHGYRELFINGQRMTSGRSNLFRPTKYFALWARGSKDAAPHIRFTNLRIRQIPFESPPSRKEHDTRIKYYMDRIQAESDHLDHFVDRGDTYRAAGQSDKAIADYEHVLDKRKDWQSVIYKLGIAHAGNGEYEKSIARYEQLLKLPSTITMVPHRKAKLAEVPLSHAQSLDRWAWLEATCRDVKFRDGDKAVERALRAIEMTKGGKREYYITLAAAYAERGDFKAGREALQKAGKLTGLSRQVLLEPMQKALEAKKPFRDQ